MKQVVFSQVAIDDLQLFKSGNQKLVFKILELISDIQKNPFDGLGKPEPLKHEYAGMWSRRINDEHRLIYKVNENSIEILKCFGHYS